MLCVAELYGPGQEEAIVVRPVGSLVNLGSGWGGAQDGDMGGMCVCTGWTVIVHIFPGIAHLSYQCYLSYNHLHEDVASLPLTLHMILGQRLLDRPPRLLFLWVMVCSVFVPSMPLPIL